MKFDPRRPYRLHERVVLRPEPFGALAYHHGNRRLNFVRSPELVQLVRTLDRHPSVRAAFDACAIEDRWWPSFERALAALAASEVLVADDHDRDRSSGDPMIAAETAALVAR